MKIGIEAKWLFDGPPSGRRVVANLVRSLADVVVDDELHLFLDARARGEPVPADIPESRRHYVWARNNQLANVFVVPRAADRAGLDAVVYQNFAPPRSQARHARVAFVHDVIFESHPEFFTRRERLYFMPLRYLTHRADRVCTVSACERSRLVRHGYAEADRVDVVPNGVDEAFAPREHLPDDEAERVLDRLDAPDRFVLYAGRLNVRKNVAALVRAVAHFTSPDLQLVVAGAPDGTSEDLSAVAAAAGIADRVRLLGPVSDADLRVLYSAATVFCFPSLDEGFGLCPLEAMASGTPAVVSNAPVMVETCGDAAVYVDPRSPSAIASGIEGLVSDAARHTELRYAGLERARAFTWDDSARRLLASVHTAVRQARGARA
jgi:glycosyltransferase involved in cell wall biosynthesis